MGKIFNKGLDKDDQKEGLFKRLKNIEKAQKDLIRDNDNESILYTPRSQFDSKHDKDEDKKKQQNNNIDTKPLNVFDYLKKLSQVAEDLMDKIEDADKGTTYISLFLLVVIGKNLTLTFSGNN